MTVQRLIIEEGRAPKVVALADVTKDWIAKGEAERAASWAKLTARYAFNNYPELRKP